MINEKLKVFNSTYLFNTRVVNAEMNLSQSVLSVFAESLGNVLRESLGNNLHMYTHNVSNVTMPDKMIPIFISKPIFINLHTVSL